MRIAHLTSAHPAHDVRIYVKECRALRAAGYQVALVAPGTREEVDDVGINIVPVRKRTRLARMLCTTSAVLATALRLRAQILHFHDPELIPVGLLLKLLGRRVIYDVHENLPDQILSKNWIPKVLRKPIARAMDCIERASAQMFDGIVAATPQIACRFPPHKTVVVQNFPIHSEFSGIPAAGVERRSPGLVYVGGIAQVRGIFEMVQAMEIVARQVPQLRLSIAGNFSPETLRTRVASLDGWKAVDFLGWQSREQIAELLSGALAGLVVLHPTRSYLDAYPVKLFEYMAAGVPVIASDFPLWRQIVTEAGCGLLVDPMNPRAIADAALWLREHETEASRMGARGAAAVASKFNWPREAAKLVEFYSRLAKPQ